MFRADTERMHANGTRIGVSAADLMQAVTSGAPALVPLAPGNDDVSLLFPFVLSSFAESIVSCTAQGCAFGSDGAAAVPEAAVSFSGSDILGGEAVKAQGAEFNA